MSDLVKDYFDRHKFAVEPSHYQQRVLTVLESLFPLLEYDSLLEVGPGQGFALSLIPDAKKIAISDLTLNTLSPLPYPAIESRLGSMPLTDAAFDVVMGFDVVEHIPDDAIDSAIQDMFRISNRYVLIGVPLAEDVIDKTTWCPQCAQVFHINHHCRRYLPEDLISYCPDGWSVKTIIYTGTRRPAKHPDATITRRLAGESKTYDRTNCPQCGYGGPFGLDVKNSQQLDIEEYNNLIKLPNALEHKRIPSSEIIVVYAKSNISIPHLPALSINEIRDTTMISHPVSTIRPGLAGNYGDKYLRKLRTIPHFQLPTEGWSIEHENLVFKLEESQVVNLVFCFPKNCYTDNNAPNSLILSGSAQGSIAISLHDDANNSLEIKQYNLDQGEFNCKVLNEFKLDPIRGYRIRLILSGQGEVKLEEVSITPGSASYVYLAKFNSSELIDLNIPEIQVLYQSPEANNQWHILPEALWLDPLMKKETDSWKRHWDQLSEKVTQHQTIRSSSVNLIENLFQHLFSWIPKLQKQKQKVTELESNTNDKNLIFPDWLVEKMECPISRKNLNIKQDNKLISDDGICRFHIENGIARKVIEN